MVRLKKSRWTKIEFPELISLQHNGNTKRWRILLDLHNTSVISKIALISMTICFTDMNKYFLVTLNWISASLTELAATTTVIYDGPSSQTVLTRVDPQTSPRPEKVSKCCSSLSVLTMASFIVIRVLSTHTFLPTFIFRGITSLLSFVCLFFF